MSNEEFFERLTNEENKLEKLYIDKRIDKYDYNFQKENIKMCREQKQKELLK